MRFLGARKKERVSECSGRIRKGRVCLSGALVKREGWGGCPGPAAAGALATVARQGSRAGGGEGWMSGGGGGGGWTSAPVASVH